MKYIATISPESPELIINAGLLYKLTGTTTLTLKNVNDEISSILYINGIKYTDGISIKNEINPYIYSIRIDFSEGTYINGSFDISISSVELTENIMTVFLTDSDINNIGSTDMDGRMINTKLESYMLLRTNPKLSGNIKLVIDSEYHLYLDTFKVSSVLNNRIYRKYPISAEGNYPHDVMTVFSKLPKSEIFKLPEDSLNPHKFYNDFKNQYFTDYEYGAETNTDNLYSENMKILAPLHIGRNVPEYFCIFRYDGTYNSDTYPDNVQFDDTEKLTNLIKTSNVVKIFDLRDYTTIGQYLNNYKKNIINFLYGSCYMQFIEQDNDLYSGNYRQGNNSWKGIDISRGIITNKIETSYFADKVLQQKSGVQETFNKYIIDGYERNDLLYPYILNLEFMFNDNSTEEYSMHRYFGLYLSENQFFKYKSIIKDNSKKNSIQKKYDEDDNEISDSAIRSKIVSDGNSYKDRIFFISTNNDAARIQSDEDISNFINEYVCNNPDKNIANVRAEETEWEEGDKSFITMTFDKPIKYGEHLRFITLGAEDENVCFEIIASNDERLKETDDFISPYISTNRPEVFNEPSSDKKENNIYRLNFYSQSLSDKNTSATLTQQFERIKACIEKFDSFITVESMNSNTIGISSKYENTYFQHIAAMNYYDDCEYEKLFIYHDTGTGNNILKYTSKEGIENYKDSYIYDISDITKLSAERLRDEDKSNESSDIFYSKLNTDKVATYVDYERNVVDDTIHYFTKSDVFHMRPLSPDSYYYMYGYSLFSTFGFDMLGWRYSSIVPFKNISELKYTYTMYDDIEDILRLYKHILTKTVNGTFETTQKIEISQGYITDNVLYLISGNLYNPTQKIKTESREYNMILSPYNVNKTLIDFNIMASLHNNLLNIYNPEEAYLSVMGIYGLKDIDMSINLNQAKTVSSEEYITIKSGDVVYIEGRDDMRISKNVLYRIVSGSFNEFGAEKFMIIENKLYTYTSSENSKINESTIFKGILTASTDVVIENINDNIKQKYNFIINIPVQYSDNYYNGTTDISTGLLSISITPQTNCLWESNSIYFDGNSVLNTDDIVLNTDPSTGKKIPYEYNGYLTEKGNIQTTDDINNTFIKNSINSYVNINDSIKSFRELITNMEIQYPIRKMLMSGNNIDTAVGYYNSYVQSIEFIYYGIKFIMKFNSEKYNQNIKMGRYNNFEVFIINDYDITINNEIFISTEEQFILFINHKYNIYGGNKNYEQIKNIDDSSFSGNVKYSINKAPYVIYPDSICGIKDMMMLHKSSDISIGTYDSSIYYIQTDIAKEEYKSDSSIYPEYLYFDYSKVNESGRYITINSSVGILNRKNGLYSVIKYTPEIVGDNLMDISYRNHYSYLMKNKVSDDYDNSSVIINYMNSFSNDYDCYVIDNGECEKITMNDSYHPITVSLSIPNRIKYNYGHFIPRTYDIINFDMNDYKLGDELGMSLLLANTKINSVNRIKTYTGNKIFNKDRNVIKNYFIENDKSIMSSNWDNDYYRYYKYDNEERFDYMNGYSPGIEDKSFFGSRCITIKNTYITIENFNGNIKQTFKKVNSTNNTNSKNVTEYEFTININDELDRLFNADDIFNSNWNGLTDDLKNSKTNYIKNTIFDMFNKERHIDIIMYGKYTKDNKNMQLYTDKIDDYSSWSVIEGISTEFGESTENYKITIRLSEHKNTMIHPVIKIYRYY